MTYEEKIAAEIESIRQENFTRIATAHRTLMIVEIDGQFEIHDHRPDGIGPPSTHRTARAAAARILQLLKTGPVAPQTWPEEVCIGSVDVYAQDEVAIDPNNCA